MSPETSANREPAPDGDDGGAAGESGGVFGNLPQTRPGARSPRRERGGNRETRRAQAARSKPRAAGTGAPKPKAPSARAGAAAKSPKAEPAPQAPESAERSGGGIEDLAWAGVAAAAEAATIGVRLATRALEAMRDATGRR